MKTGQMLYDDSQYPRRSRGVVQMKPGCGKCFKVAEKNGNEYICPSCGDVVAQIPTMMNGKKQKESEVE